MGLGEHMTTAYINLDNLAHNIRTLSEMAAERHSQGKPCRGSSYDNENKPSLTRVAYCLPVKANAYGHGLVTVSRFAQQIGVDYLGVARIEEAQEIRAAGITLPIMLFAYPDDDEIHLIPELRVEPFVGDLQLLDRIAKEADLTGTVCPVHLIFDTGMGRLGFHPDEIKELIPRIVDRMDITIQGLCTHLAVADQNDPDSISYTMRQIVQFREVVDAFTVSGHRPEFIHAENSGAVTAFPEDQKLMQMFNLIRPGISSYGISDHETHGCELLPVMSLKTRVSTVRTIHAGQSVSYGRTWVAEKDSRIAVLPIGYGDGLNRLLSNKGCVRIGDRQYPIVGRICMDQTMVLIDDDQSIQRDTPVEIFGYEESSPKVSEIAQMIGTIPYEVLCAVSGRVPRIYL